MPSSRRTIAPRDDGEIVFIWFSDDLREDARSAVPRVPQIRFSGQRIKRFMCTSVLPDGRLHLEVLAHAQQTNGLQLEAVTYRQEVAQRESHEAQRALQSML